MYVSDASTMIIRDNINRRSLSGGKRALKNLVGRVWTKAEINLSDDHRYMLIPICVREKEGDEWILYTTPQPFPLNLLLVPFLVFVLPSYNKGPRVGGVHYRVGGVK